VEYERKIERQIGGVQRLMPVIGLEQAFQHGTVGHISIDRSRLLVNPRRGGSESD
jgi:hypothetical protein